LDLIIYTGSAGQLPQYTKSLLVFPGFTFDEDNTRITGLNLTDNVSSNYPFPPIPDGVFAIANNAFLNKTALTGSVIIPRNVGLIGTSAFSGCTGLTSVTYFATTSVGTDAFKSITPAKITVFPGFVIIDNIITDIAITGATTLTFPTIPDTVTGIGASAFKGKSNLTGPIIFPSSVTSIGSLAFAGCTGLTDYTFANKLTSAGYDIFAGTKLANNWFADCNLLTTP
jgi:hypothetical protein